MLLTTLEKNIFRKCNQFRHTHTSRCLYSSLDSIEVCKNALSQVRVVCQIKDLTPLYMLYLWSILLRIIFYVTFHKAFKYPILKEQKNKFNIKKLFKVSWVSEVNTKYVLKKAGAFFNKKVSKKVFELTWLAFKTHVFDVSTSHSFQKFYNSNLIPIWLKLFPSLDCL